MEKEGIINCYWTEINTLRLGYDVYRIYINFQDVSPDTKEDIIKYFASWSNAWAVISSKGPIDLNVMVWVNNSNKFHQLWNDTLEKYGAFFTKHTISVLTSGIAFKKSFLVSDEYNQDNRKYFILNNVGKNIELDNLDYQLLNEIALNARAPITELGKKLKCSSQTINYRIKNLIKKGIILALRVSINMEKIGFQHPGVDVYLRDHTKKKQIINYISENPFVEYIIEAIGWADITFELVTKNFEHLNQIMEDIDLKFPNAIRKQNYRMSRTYHRLRSLPEMEFK